VLSAPGFSPSSALFQQNQLFLERCVSEAIGRELSRQNRKKFIEDANRTLVALEAE
jgi:hypothetical protein